MTHLGVMSENDCLSTHPCSEQSEGGSEMKKNKAWLSCMCGSQGLMIDVRVSFGRVICMVVGSWGPVVAKLALRFAALEPPETHVHGFHLLSDDGFVGNP